MLANEFFDTIFALNLPERRDRRQLIEEEMAKQGIKGEIFPAIHPETAGGFPTVGARGCFLSHLAMIKEAKRRGAKNLLILEDDLAISAEWAGMIAGLERQEWAFAYFGHRLDIQGRGWVSYTGPIVTTHFVAINGSQFAPLIAFLERVGPMHVDGAYNTFRQQHPEAITLVALPSLGWQKRSRSDIAPLRWFDRLPGVRHLVASLRRFFI